jgi:calcineurin-like phosphoesterase
VSVDEGPFLKSGGNTFLTYHLNTTDEHLVVDCTLEGYVHGVNGTGTLMMARFEVMKNGTCDLNLYDTQLFDSHEKATSHLVHGGHFNT